MRGVVSKHPATDWPRPAPILAFLDIALALALARSQHPLQRFLRQLLAGFRLHGKPHTDEIIPADQQDAHGRRRRRPPGSAARICASCRRLKAGLLLLARRASSARRHARRRWPSRSAARDPSPTPASRSNRDHHSSCGPTCGSRWSASPPPPLAGFAQLTQLRARLRWILLPNDLQGRIEGLLSQAVRSKRLSAPESNS